MEVSLSCVAAQNTSDWSTYLVWIEYSDNSHPSSASSISPFEASLMDRQLTQGGRALTLTWSKGLALAQKHSYSVHVPETRPPPDSLELMKLTESLILPVSISTCPLLSRSTPLSIFHKSSPSRRVHFARRLHPFLPPVSLMAPLPSLSGFGCPSSGSGSLVRHGLGGSWS